MHVRFSMVYGTPVVENQTDSLLGKVTDILIHPDTGAVLGFFVRTPGLLGGSAFLSTTDIVAWGTQIHVADDSRLSDPFDIVRIKTVLSDPRSIMHQRIVTKRSKRVLGVCWDVQFDTKQFVIQWLFPRKWFFLFGPPVVASDIIEVKPHAILVKEQKAPVVQERAKKDSPLEVVLPDVLPATSYRRAKLKR